MLNIFADNSTNSYKVDLKTKNNKDEEIKKCSIKTELRKVVLGSGNWFMMSPWFLGTSVFYDTVLIKERLNLMNKYHFSMHLSLILIKSFIINLQFYPFWRYYLKVSLIPGCWSQLVPENRHGFRKLVSRVSMFSQLCMDISQNISIYQPNTRKIKI